MTSGSAARRLAVAAVVVALLLGGCGGEAEAPAPPSRPVTAEEAGILAGVLHRNVEAGGAHFDATATISGATVRLRGVVSWTDHAGSAALSIGSVAPYSVVTLRRSLCPPRLGTEFADLSPALEAHLASSPDSRATPR